VRERERDAFMRIHLCYLHCYEILKTKIASSDRKYLRRRISFIVHMLARIVMAGEIKWTISSRDNRRSKSQVRDKMRKILVHGFGIYLFIVSCLRRGESVVPNSASGRGTIAKLFSRSLELFRSRIE